ncbi:MAG TPA: response regulator [Gemmatimonadales bacterium]|nr:response regulator [Gemmatimonadales bacterium]
MTFPNTPNSRRYWGTQRVARVCQVSPATVANWIDQGLLKGHKTPTGRRRVSADDLTAFLRAHAMAVPPELDQGSEQDAVVVVDDDPGYLKALVLTIERSDLDVDVVEAATGVDALLEIGRVQPSLIVLDYSLPDLNAPEVIRRLLEPGRQLHAEVIVVTGGMPEAAGKELRQMGVKVILNKADGMPAVVEAMRQALERRKAA